MSVSKAFIDLVNFLDFGRLYGGCLFYILFVCESFAFFLYSYINKEDVQQVDDSEKEMYFRVIGITNTPLSKFKNALVISII